MLNVTFTVSKGPCEKSNRPSFRGLLIHFYSTKLQFIVMFTLKDIFHVVLRVKGVGFFCEHLRKINRFLDPIIPIFYLQRHLLFRHE